MKIIKRLFLISTMGFIFYMSSMNGSDSTYASNIFIDLIYKMYSLFSHIDIDTFKNMFTNVIREFAHFFEFFIFGIALYINGLDFFKNSVINKCILIGVLYAVFDEIHQIFRQERTFEVLDISLDSLGVIIGIILIHQIIKLWKKK